MVITYLITDIMCLVSAIFSAIVNIFVIYCFFRKKVQLSSDNLRLAVFLACADLAYAISALIHVGYLTISWSNTLLDYNPYIIIYTNAFLPSNLKIVIVISLTMAFDRCLAINYPVFYHKANRILYANISLFIAGLWFLFDFFFQIVTAPYHRIPNCATMACFVHKYFLDYLSISNTVAGILIMIMSSVVFAGVQKMRKRSFESRSPKSSNVFRQANNLTVGILLCSLFFVTIPSILATLYESLTGVSLFQLLGPFYIFSILLNGTANGLVFVIVNWKNLKIKASGNMSLATTSMSGPGLWWKPKRRATRTFAQHLCYSTLRKS